MPLSLGMVEGAFDVVGGLFGNPKDEARIAEAKMLRDRAIAGDDLAFIKLKCLSGDQTVLAEACRTGAHRDACGASECGYATTRARDFAKTMVAEVNARRGVATAAGAVTQGSYVLGTGAAPGAYFAQLGIPAISPVLVIGLVGLAVWAFTRKGR